ncbi:MAG: hypothetical protein HQK66_09925 [Desulfamplus sp.]|nr:hypothetical protein [Desulfamplus sp.]
MSEDNNDNMPEDNHTNRSSLPEEWEILGHEPVPGYKSAFYIAVALSVIYLIIAFTLDANGVSH